MAIELKLLASLAAQIEKRMPETKTFFEATNARPGAHQRMRLGQPFRPVLRPPVLACVRVNERD
jgi:hypothetical protein